VGPLRGSSVLDDVKLRQEGTIRIYDIILSYDVLLETDAFIRKILQAEPFQKGEQLSFIIC